jgi:glycosyltransferase involved in cell wall biosynthesis
MDWDLVQTLVLENSYVDFCFAGSKSDSNMKMLTLSHFDNFHYLGRLSGNELPSYLKAADIMLLAYRADEFTDQLANPHKAMEYLASGKVLVATYTDELRVLRDEQLICMSDKNVEFPSLFSTALKNLFNWNSTEKAEKRRQYALENKYEKQIERIELILK